MRLKESPNRLKSSRATLKHFQIQKQTNQKHLLDLYCEYSSVGKLTKLAYTNQ